MPDQRITLDETDRALLALVQRSAQMTSVELGAALHLSPSQAARRRQRLEAEGLIAGYAARLDAGRLGLTVQAFVQVELARHGAEPGAAFARLVRQHAEIVSVWTLTGSADYLLRVYCADLGALNRLLHQVLLAHPGVARVQSQIVLDQLKTDAPLPI